jgi:hypothetical protein
MQRKMLFFLVGLLTLTLSLPAAAQGKSQGKGKPAEAGKKSDDAEKENSKAAEDIAREKLAAEGHAFSKKDEATIRIRFGDKRNLEGLPPGLAKREELPPGLERHLERNGTLPPGLQKRIQPLPRTLEIKLPKLPEGIRRVIVVGAVILLDVRTSKIIDIIKDVVGGGGEKSSTGVQRTG